MKGNDQNQAAGLYTSWREDARALFALGAPMALAQLVQFSIHTIDVLMVGRLGPDALAAAALGMAIFYAGWLSMSGAAMAVSPLVSQALGADRDDVRDVRRSVRMSLWLIFAVFPPLLLASFFAEDVALVLGQPPALAEQAGRYVVSLAPVIPFGIGAIALRNFLAALGETRMPLFIIIAMTLLNAFLNFLFIFGSWGAPRLELVGAGIASSLANAFGFFALVFYCRIHKEARRFHLFEHFWRIDWGRMREIIRLGAPISVTIAFEAMLFNAAVFLMGRIGVIETAAYQVAINVAAIAFMAPLGLSMAGAVRVGLYAGAGDLSGVRRSSVLTIAMSICAIMVICIPTFIMPGGVAGLYLDRSDPENAVVLELVAQFLRIACLFMLFDAVQVAAIQSLRGLKDVAWPMAITAIAYWAVGFPAAAWLSLRAGVGANGVWWGLLLSLGAAALMLSFRLWLKTRPGASLENAVA